MNREYYRPLEIWARLDSKSMICCTMFQRMSGGYYVVQSGDRYYENDKLKDSITWLGKQKYELFIEGNIEEFDLFRKTIGEAVDAFEDFFLDDSPEDGEE